MGVVMTYRHFLQKLKPNAVMLVTAVSVIILIFVAFLTLNKIENDTRHETGRVLQAILKTSHAGFRRWADEIERETLIWAQSPNIVKFTRELLNTERTQDALIRSKAQKDIRALLRPVYVGKGYLGYFVIGPNDISLASSREENTGSRNLLAKQPEFINRVREGMTGLSLPQKSDVPLRDVSENLVEELPTMFVGAPIRDETGVVLAILAFVLIPTRISRLFFNVGAWAKPEKPTLSIIRANFSVKAVLRINCIKADCSPPLNAIFLISLSATRA